jgi:integrase
MAIVRLFLDTGMRLAELGGLGLKDVDFEQNIAIVWARAAAASLSVQEQDGAGFGSVSADPSRPPRQGSARVVARPESWLGQSPGSASPDR